MVIPGESQADFDHLLEEYKDEWNPRGRTQERLVEELTAIAWKLTRFARVEQAYHRQTIAAGSDLATLPSIDIESIDFGNDRLFHPRPAKLDDAEARVAVTRYDDRPNRVDPDAAEAMQRYLRRLLEFRSRDSDSLKLAVFHLPRKFRELWTTANEDPPAFARFLRSHDLSEVKIHKADWPNFAKWVTDFAVPYLRGLHAMHAKARDHQQHSTEIMNLTTMEGMESILRYEDRLLVQRKNALAVLLRLQGR